MEAAKYMETGVWGRGPSEFPVWKIMPFDCDAAN
jgi:hypothetical protein